jgi:hypothetical protein
LCRHQARHGRKSVVEGGGVAEARIERGGGNEPAADARARARRNQALMRDAASSPGTTNSLRDTPHHLLCRISAHQRKRAAALGTSDYASSSRSWRGWTTIRRLAKHSGIDLVSYFTTTSPAFFVFLLGCLAGQTLAFNVTGTLCFHSADVLSFRSGAS